MNTKIICGFIGQGFIGKNLADNFEQRGYQTIRYSLEEPYINNKDLIKTCDITFLAVPTPTTPSGFDASIVRESLSLIGKGKIAVIKSTIVPTTTEKLQQEFPDIIVLYSPEFLSVSTAAEDTANPFSNIVGVPANQDRYLEAANKVHGILPQAKFNHTCSSTEAEMIKYSHNVNGYFQIILANILYDLSRKLGCNWNDIYVALQNDPYISNRYSQPVHKDGRGAAGFCFIKDFAAFKNLYGAVNETDVLGNKVLESLEKKNIELLIDSQKDIDLLRGVYGEDVIKS